MRKCKMLTVVVKVDQDGKKRKLILCHMGGKIKAGNSYA